MRKVLADTAELNARIYQFPTSAIKIGGKKLNYHDFISSNQNADCTHAVQDISERINIGDIHALIDETPFLTTLQREFYKTYISARANILFR